MSHWKPKDCPICGHIHTGQYGEYCPTCANIHPDKIFEREAKYHCNMCGRPMHYHGTCTVCQNLHPRGKPKKPSFHLDIPRIHRLRK